MKKLFLALIAVSSLTVSAQEKKEEPKFGIKFSGFVKTDAFYDTRQTVNAREGHFLLYPENIAKDAYGFDYNSVPNFNMLSIQSRLKGAITGPDAFGAKTSGVLEADFFGNSSAGLDDVNGFRLRHAFVKLNWTKAELLMGQYWNPMFTPESFAGTVSFNTGAPFQPFSRNPQMRFSYNICKSLKFTATAYSQRDFTSIGPDGLNTDGTVKAALASSRYARNSGMPTLNFLIQFNPDSTEHQFGIGADYKTITPRLYSEIATTTAATYTLDTITNKITATPAKTTIAKFKVDEQLASVSAFVYAKLKFKPVTVKLQCIYAQNAYDLSMIGGYAATKIVNTTTGELAYTNINTGSAWMDITTNGKKVQFGLFSGYTKNLGATDTITGATYARGANIDNVFRVSPRVVFISGKLDIGFELEGTYATYGTANSNKMGAVTSNRRAIANTRALLAFTYKF